MNTVEFLRGHVTRYEKEKHFGFIETADKQSYFFHRDKTEVIRQKRAGIETGVYSFNPGDEVEFRVRPAEKENGRLEAYDIVFIKNEQRDKLMAEAEQGLPLTGYLKSIKDKLFVKHISTYLLIPVDVSAWETDLEETYHSRLDSMVTFRLDKPGKVGKLRAILEGRKFAPVYDELVALKDSGESVEGTITGKNEDGYFVSVLGDVQGFVSAKDIPAGDKELFFKYDEGDRVMVRVRAIHKNKKLSLEFF